ncbi:hypothetical protein [Streptomyces sp. bgisy126]|uniref:hypothetical protein n=1 Tax=unclassified Streptomyces TaxID=2593676 RepID=UPI003EB8FDC3
MADLGTHSGSRAVSGSMPASPASGELDGAAALAYDAFRARHQSVYATFAAIRLPGHGCGDAAVRVAFAEIRDVWHATLRAASPASVAWALLNSVLDTHAARVGAPTASPAVTVILCHQMGLTPGLAAEVMGVGLSEFTARHRAESRSLHQD